MRKEKRREEKKNTGKGEERKRREVKRRKVQYILGREEAIYLSPKRLNCT